MKKINIIHRLSPESGKRFSKIRGEIFLPKFIGICMETPCWCPFGPTRQSETNRNVCHRVLPQEREFISRGTKKHLTNAFSYTWTFQVAKLPEMSYFSRPSCKCRVTQKLRNSSAVYHKTKYPFGGKMCMNISFQLFLYIMKVKSIVL